MTAAVLAAAAVAAAPPVASDAAPAAPSYTLAACLRSGLSRSVPVANAARERAAAEAVIAQTRARILPQVTAKGDYLRYDRLDAFEFNGTRMEFGRLDNFMTALEASQLVYDGGSVQAALKAARAYRDRAGLAEARIRAALARDIAIGFYTVLHLDEAVKVQQEAVEQLERFAEQTEEKFRRGAASEFDALGARVRADAEAPALAAARREAGVARAAFRHIARLPDGPFALDGQLVHTAVEADPDAALSAALSNRWELEELRRLAELRAADVRAERGAYAPAIRIRGAWQGRNPESFASPEDRWDWGWEAGMTVEWHLFDGLLREGRIREKVLALESARADVEEMEQAIRVEVEEAVLRLREAAEAVAASARTVEQAEKGVAIARTRFDAGLSTWLEFTDTSLALRRARLQKSAALRDHLEAAIRLRHVTGRIVIPENLDEPPALP